jgi:4-hydroxy-tetrahydrodipicolinate synthase
MTPNGLKKVVEAARQIYTNAPELLGPVADFFNVNIEERLENPAHREGLCYESYE